MNTLPMIIEDPAADQTLPRIIVDSNERDQSEDDSDVTKRGYLEILGKDDLFQVVRCRLDVGDILIQNLIIERKTGHDLVSSIEDGRLFRQINMMRRLYQKRLLLIEGSVVGQRRVARAGIEGALTRISAYQQVPILFSDGGEMTARLIRRMALQLYGFTTPQAHRTIGSKGFQDYYQIHVLVGIPGVGLTRARALIEAFGTLKEVFSASASDLKKVAGIGPYLAQELVTLFRGICNSDGSRS